MLLQEASNLFFVLFDEGNNALPKVLGDIFGLVFHPPLPLAANFL